MPVYTIADAGLDSTIDFPELLERRAGASAVMFRITDATLADDVAWYHHLDDRSGCLRTSLGRRGRSYIVRFHGVADFILERDRACWTVACAPMEHAAIAAVRHLLLDQIVPMLLNGADRLALHASAVTTPAGAVAFVGASGAGKSTLAAAFWTNGDTLVADDVLLLSPSAARPFAVPAYPSIRLWRDAASVVLPDAAGASAPVVDSSDKLRIALSARDAARERSAVEIRALYLVDDRTTDPHASIESIGPRERFRALLEHVYRLDPFDRDANAREVDLLHQIASGLRIKRLRVPRRFDALAAVRDCVIADLTAG